MEGQGVNEVGPIHAYQKMGLKSFEEDETKKKGRKEIHWKGAEWQIPEG